MTEAKRKSTARDMTEGPILREILLFALPLLLGNVFQMLYNTVDVWVVGNFVSTQALAAVGSTTAIVNMLVFFFNGFSVGAGVVIANHFGAKDMDRLHAAVETTMATTFLFCLLFTIIGTAAVRPMLAFMSTPDDVLEDAAAYLGIYFSGISGLLVYNMGSGILRAVGDTTRPLLFLILTSVLNIFLDLFFVLALHMGIEGVAVATILSQFLSAALILLLLTRSKDIYRLIWRDLSIDPGVLRRIFAVGLPAGVQSVITAFSNVFVQAYVNAFGSSVMAGWGCYNRLDQFIMLPLQSMAMASTTFVSQNIGAGKEERADRGTRTAILVCLAVTGTIACFICLLAPQAVGLFTEDAAVVSWGVLFLRANTFFLLFNSVNHVLAGALRGRGDARGPMIILLFSFVAVRQVYLFIMTRFIANTPFAVGLGYPVGWAVCCILETLYARRARKRRQQKAAGEQSLR